MSDPSFELQETIYLALKGQSPAIAGGRIYDRVPTAPTFPYITIGPCQVLPDKAGCIDGSIAYPTVDIWSRAVGFPEVKTITKEVLAVLDEQPLTVAGFQLVWFEYDSIQYLRDPDGLTQHAALTFHGLLQPS